MDTFNFFFFFTPNQLHNFSQRCDLDKDGKLDFTEFQDMISRYRERKQLLMAMELAEEKTTKADLLKKRSKRLNN